MFVSENFECNPGHVKIRISTMEGTSAWLAVDSLMSCDALKIEAVGQLFDCPDSSKMSLYYNLLHVTSGRILSEEQTLRQAVISNNDELLLVRRRSPPTTLPSPKKIDSSAPSAEDIAKATEHLHVLNIERNRPEAAADIDFQSELRKILVSLIDVAQKLVCLSSAKDFKEAQKYVFCGNAPPAQKSPSSPAVGEKALQQLIEMGFSRARATKALLVNRMSHVRAIQWLCDNADDDDGGDDETEGSAPDQASASGRTTSGSTEQLTQTAEDVVCSSDENVKAELVELAKLSGPAKVQRMLDAFKCYKRRVFKPDPASLQSLLEMGFDEGNAVDALRMYNNSKDEACDWLLNRATNHGAASPVDCGALEGLDPASSLYSAIVSNHVIQLALTSHKTLIALLHILENPETRQQWLRDADLNPMLVQISRIYHAEKYGR